MLKEQLSCHTIAEVCLRFEEKSVVIIAWEISGSCRFSFSFVLIKPVLMFFRRRQSSFLGTASLLLVALVLLVSLCLDAWSVNYVTSRDLEEEGQCLPHGKDDEVLRMAVQYSCMSMICLLGICGLSESGLCQAGFEWFLWKGTSSMEHAQNPLGRKISYKCFGKVLTHGQPSQESSKGGQLHILKEVWTWREEKRGFHTSLLPWRKVLGALCLPQGTAVFIIITQRQFHVFMDRLPAVCGKCLL